MPTLHRVTRSCLVGFAALILLVSSSTAQEEGAATSTETPVEEGGAKAEGFSDMDLVPGEEGFESIPATEGDTEETAGACPTGDVPRKDEDPS